MNTADDIEFKDEISNTRLVIRLLDDGAIFARIWGVDLEGRPVFENIITESKDDSDRLKEWIDG